MQVVTKRLAVMKPENPQWAVSWANATRRADSIEAARLILLNAVKDNPNMALFYYNLACYECQLGNLDEAKKRLKQVFELEPGYRMKALEGEDLQVIWGAFF
jgi:tetratricopeptide (TPR) repeat protein